MTYKEIINRIRTVAQDHLMIKDFGYGELSDIKTQAQFGPGGNIDDGKEADYPYMFLLPRGSTRNDPVVNYNFSMIMMDMARGEEGDKYDNYITIQSQCQQYIDDCLANLYYFYKDQPMVQLTGITYTPFKEAYQDEVAGMTCNFTIEVPNGLNDCIAPFGNLVSQWTQTAGPNYVGGGQNKPDANGNTSPFQPTLANNYMRITEPVITATPPYWDPTIAIGPNVFGSFAKAFYATSIELTYDMTYTWDPITFAGQVPDYYWYDGVSPSYPGDIIPVSLAAQSGPVPVPTSITGFPFPSVSTPVVGQKYQVKMIWENINITTGITGFRTLPVTFNASPPASDVAQFKMENLTLKIYA